MRAPDLRLSHRRLAVARALLALLFLVLALRVGQLALWHPRAIAQAEAQGHTVLRLAARRGLILDRHGAELAVSSKAPSVVARPGAIADPVATARALAGILDLEAAHLARRLDRPGGSVFVKRWVTDAQAARVEERALTGIHVAHEPRRDYPYGELAGRLVGFANIDGKGVRGVEQQLDGWLRGRAQAYAVERDARGRLLAVSGVDPRAASGGDVALTLDAALQADAEAALEAAIARTGAAGGLVLTLDPRSGEILAAAERPGFDPNRFREVPYASTRARAFVDALEPGSTLKAFVVAAALEAGTLDANDVIDCAPYAVAPKTFRDKHEHEALDVAGVLRLSSNVGVVKIAQALGARAHFAALERFGFGRPTGSGFPSESAGLLNSWRRWKPIDQATIAFGQGVSVTAVQLAAAFGALANDGVRMRPRLVRARRRRTDWQAIAPEAAGRAVSPETARQMLAMLEGVVSAEGTAPAAALHGVRVAGKTGTAQMLEAATGTYATDRYHAWFVGIVPADDPQLVIVTELDEPRAGLHYGGTSAAPLFGRVAAAQLARLGRVTAPTRPAPTLRAEAPPPVAAEAPPPVAAPPRPAPTTPALAREGDRVLLPDLRGLSVAEVRRITDAAKIRVEIQGTGRAVAQDPAPGTILTGEGKRVRVRFTAGGGRI